jgi:nitrite reductase (NADH) large subunit
MTSEYDAQVKTSWNEEQKVQLFLNDKALHLDTTQKIITGASGRIIPYDVAVLATGSFPFGGGLLGLEAAKAVYDIGVEEMHIIEFAPILMARQIDAGGHEAIIWLKLLLRILR